MEADTAGYRGRALELLKGANLTVGDIIRVEEGDSVHEGTLLPRAVYGDDSHVVLKLKSGYNIGIEISGEARVTFLGHGEKPAFRSSPQPDMRSDLPRTAIISTGGTIASRVDYRTGSVLPALNARDLYHFVPELADIAAVETEILYGEFSENLGPKHWKEMALAVARQIRQGKQGVVLSHGTDTMGYTAAALSFSLRDLPVPVIIVGSQRSSDRPSSDAASNLVAATTVAARAPIAEVVLLMHESTSDEYAAIHRGTRVRKCHTSSRDAFESINSPPLGRISLKDGKIEMSEEPHRDRDPSRDVIVKAEFEEKVALVKFYPNMDPNIFDWLIDRSYRGIVIEGSGLGHVSRACFAPIKRAVDTGVVIGMTSQCIWGAVNMNVYETGRDLLAIGVQPLGDMLAETAYIKMMWALGQTKDAQEARRIMVSNISGEMADRRLNSA
ncbi:MAG: Glu-tRNA(Gln) amidotransferase subunit GatD [archaeon]